MLDDHGLEIYENNEFPLAYLITFRTYGTWLHGDERSSIRRNRKTETETKSIPANIPLKERMIEETNTSAVLLSKQQRKIVEEAINEVCKFRSYILHAVNARSNHVHSVIGAHCRPERIADSLKAYATRKLREAEGGIELQDRVWARGRSRKYLWKPRHVDAAVEYVLFGQGDLPFEIED